MVEKLALTYHQFSLELGSVLRELEEDPFEVLILKDSESVDCLGFQIVKLERNNKYYLPFFIAAELVRHGHAEWTQNIETKKNLLNRLASVFGSEQRSQVLSPPDNNSLSSLIMQLRQSFIQNSGGDLDQRLSQEFSNLVSQRLQKILVKLRIEERRVGKECRSRWSPHH